MAKISCCVACKVENVDLLIDFGPQPPSNRYQISADSDIDRHSLIIGQCGQCGLIQLINPMPVEMVKPRFPWIYYREPEQHLDSFVDRLIRLPGIDQSSVIYGITYKEDSTLQRLTEKGYRNVYRLDQKEDLDITDPNAGLETIQAKINVSNANRIKEDNGPANIVYARHILEHCHDPATFIKCLSCLSDDNGYLVFEVPDSSKFIDSQDYIFVWEEHISYFIHETLKNFILMNGLSIVDLLRYEYPYEDCLIVIARKGNVKDGSNEHKISACEKSIENGMLFSSNYKIATNNVMGIFAGLKNQQIRIAIFGAGHLAAKFINLYHLHDLVDTIIDDHPEKYGLYMPGTKIKIKASDELDNIDICFLTLNPESETIVRKKNKKYTERGGEFYSIFRRNPLNLERCASDYNISI